MAGSNSALNLDYGVAGQVATSNGPGIPPSFQDPAGGALSPGYASGYYYYINGVGTIASTTQIVAKDLIYVFPFYVFESASFQNLSINVTLGGADLRVGLYNFDGLPLTVNQTLGVIDVSTMGVKTLALAPLLLDAGYYGFALQASSAATISGVNSTTSKGNILPIGTSFSASTAPGMVNYAGAYAGGLIDLTGGTPSNTNNQILIGFQVS